MPASGDSQNAPPITDAKAPLQRMPASASAAGVIQAKVSRGSGWAGRLMFTWVDNEAAAIWTDIDAKFNTQLPAMKADLAELNVGFTSAAAKQRLAASIKAVETLLTTQDDKTLDYSNAKGLQAAVTRVLTDAALAKTEANSTETEEVLKRAAALKKLHDTKCEKIDEMLAELQDAAYNPVGNQRNSLKKELLAAKGEDGGWKTDQQKDLVKKCSDLKIEAQSILDEKNRKKADDLKRREIEEQNKKETARIAAEQKRLSTKFKTNFSALMSGCDNDVDTLVKLEPKFGLGEAGKVASALAFLTPDEWLELHAVHGTSAEDINKMVGKTGAGHAANLKRMLETIGKSDDAKLIALLDDTDGDKGGKLAGLLAKAKISTVATVLAQMGDDPGKVETILAPAGVKKEGVESLLASDSKADTSFLIEKLPDTDFLVKLRPIIADPPMFKLLVADLGANAAGLIQAKALLAREGGAAKDEITGHADVKKARGLQTNAGADIATCTLGDLTGTGEKAGVEATLAHIRGGAKPELTHGNGAVFGDPHQNNAGLLPGARGAGGYKEYYVEKDPADTGSYHGSRRLVVSDTTKHIYYTKNHYTSFRRLMV
jgi:guanyl-specific ribonuclease Sa